MPVSTIPYILPPRAESWQMEQAEWLLSFISRRRSCRHFSDRPVPRELIEKLVAIAHTAPSGANRRPWRFVVVDDPQLKRRIRMAAETEEKISYEHRMPKEWLDALEPIGTTWEKPFLEIAPYLVVLFRVDFEVVDGKKLKSYYPVESTGLAAGFFLAACHAVGLATLTHTPSPMNFLRDILKRPENEKPYLLIPVGYPAPDATVPDLARKPLSEVLIWNAPHHEDNH